MNSQSVPKGEGASIRHCAYCLNVCGLPAKICGGCKKRAYCSKDCQAKDWSRKGDGQGHFNWCRRHECGEEDVDWEVVPIPNKGLGIRAKKLIPAGFKIIVEPTFSSGNDHPGFKDLGPDGSPLEHKFFQNLFMAHNNANLELTVAMRFARVNHSCHPNADAIYDEMARVGILFAQEDIQPGEEICICYYSPFFGLFPGIRVPEVNPECSVEEELNFAKSSIQSRFGITCPTDCSCKDPEIPALVQEGRHLHGTVRTLARQGKIEEALAAGEKLLDIHRRLNKSWFYRSQAEYLLFKVSVTMSKMLPRAKEYIRSAAELFGKICPYSERFTKTYERLIKHPEEDPDYLQIDRRMAVVSRMIEMERLMSGSNL